MADLLTDARKYKRRAVEQLLAQHYPAAWRMAVGLTGREDVARGVVRFLYSRALRVLPNWKIDSAPENWFLHHTVLTARRTQKHQPAADEDVLAGKGAGAAYIAFVKAVRSLPQQQKEAFILHYGERLAARSLGVAMDCSTEAAQNHLKAAEEAMRAIGGDHYATMVGWLRDVYQSVTPEESIVLPRVRKAYSRFMRPRRIRRFVMIVAAIVVAFAVWKLRR
jgi:DNA-directed RNA polymerase specialized sigma24 family protein